MKPIIISDQIFGELSVTDEQSLIVELDLLAKTAGLANMDDFEKRLSDLLHKESPKFTALRVAHWNAIPINVEAIELADLQKSFPSHHESRKRLQREFRLGNWKGLSDGKVIDLAMSEAFYRRDLGPFKESWINELFDFLAGMGRQIFGTREAGVLFPIYFFQRPMPESAAEIHSKLEVLDGCASDRYLNSLLNAIQSPTDLSLYAAAEAEEAKLTGVLELASHLRVNSQLGPGPSSFESNEHWIKARKSVFQIEPKELEEWFGKLDGYSWLILFLPRDGWQYLDPFVASRKLDELNGDVLDRLHLMSGGGSNVAVLIQHYDVGPNNFDIIKAMVRIACELGTSFMKDSYLVRILSHSEFSFGEDDDLSDLLARCAELDCPPEFCVSVVSGCLGNRVVDVSQVVEFWSSHCAARHIWMDSSVDEAMSALLDVNNDEATELAASLRYSGRVRRSTNPEIASEVARRYCGVLKNKTRLGEHDLSRLFGVPAQVDEIELWCREDTLDALQKSEWGLDSFRERLMEIINASSGNSERIREVLGTVIQNRTKYASEIGLGAVDAIHRLDEITSSPLADADWQVLRT